MYLIIKVYFQTVYAAAAKSLQSWPTLCDPIDSSPPGSPVPGILQARTLEWVAISFSNAWRWKVRVKSLSRVRLLVTPWTAAHQAPPSMRFSRWEYWSGVPLLSPKLCINGTYQWLCATSLFSLLFNVFLRFIHTDTSGCVVFLCMYRKLLLYSAGDGYLNCFWLFAIKHKPAPRGLWDLSFPARDWTWPLDSESRES